MFGADIIHYIIDLSQEFYRCELIEILYSKYDEIRKIKSIIITRENININIQQQLLFFLSGNRESILGLIDLSKCFKCFNGEDTKTYMNIFNNIKKINNMIEELEFGNPDIRNINNMNIPEIKRFISIIDEDLKKIHILKRYKFKLTELELELYQYILKYVNFHMKTFKFYIKYLFFCTSYRERYIYRILKNDASFVKYFIDINL